MSVVVSGPRAGESLPGRWARRRDRRDERRRLARRDQLGARLAELHRIRELLEQTIVLVNVGWTQNAWFTVIDEQGRQRKLIVPDFDLAEEQPVSGVCLVGGIVYAAGGPHAARSQLVQRALDLTWHTLHESSREPVRWCPPPAVRTMHVRDLTRWNDHPQRTVGQVSGLLQSALAATDTQIELSREQALPV